MVINYDFAVGNNFSDDFKSLFTDAIEWFHRETCLRFVEIEPSEDADFLVTGFFLVFIFKIPFEASQANELGLKFNFCNLKPVPKLQIQEFQWTVGIKAAFHTLASMIILHITKYCCKKDHVRS